jgi:hypothetical protein
MVNLIGIRSCIALALVLVSAEICSVAQIIEKPKSEFRQTTNSLSAPSPAQGSSVQGHTVTLSWIASIPATSSLHDTVTSYNVYRNTTIPVAAIPENKVSCLAILTTSCIDNDVKSGQTYYYVVTAVAAGANGGKGAESKPSSPPLEVTIKIP